MTDPVRTGSEHPARVGPTAPVPSRAVKLPGRRAREDAAVAASEPEPTGSIAGKGRPTPKRRDSGPKRGPVAPAPTSRREAMRWQREHAKTAKPNSATGPTLTPAERRERMAAGDPRYLMRRDQGEIRQLARDYVDSRRMLSNFLLILFPLLILLPLLVRSPSASYGNIAILVIFLIFIVEWVFTGRKLLAMAAARGIETKEKALGLGFYAGQRAYLPRRFRQPRPRTSLGDEI